MRQSTESRGGAGRRFRSDAGKWLSFGFLTLIIAYAAVTLATGFPNGGSILLEAGSVVQTPALCASMPECHQFGSTLNQRGGVSFSGLPESYAPGVSYPLGLEITGTAQTQFYGFQLAVFFEEDMRQAGTLASETPNVQVIEFGGHQLLTHLDRLESGSVSFIWTAPAVGAGPVVFRVASNSADGNGTNTGDHINTLDVVVPAQTSADSDGDGVDDDVEDAAPNAGDGNGDGTPDRMQNSVASLPETNTGAFVTLAAPAGAALTGAASTGSPFSADMPLGVEFPLGFWTFQLSPAGGPTATVEFLSESAATDAYFNYGPTPQNPEPHWYDFSFDGETGAEYVDGRLILHYRDGARGDHDLTANSQVGTLGGPGTSRRILYFPQIAVGTTAGSEFRTELVFVNAAATAAAVRSEFFDSEGIPLQVAFSVNGAPSGPASLIERPLTAGGSLRILLSEPGEIQVGYARVWTDPGVGGTAVFSLTAGGEILYQAGVPATEALSDFSLAAGVSPGTDTGLALVNASQGPGMTASQAASARVTLRLYDQDFNLLESTTADLPAAGHLPRFVTQFFPTLLNSPDFFGSVSVESDQPLAAVTLRLTDAPTLTTFPVVPGRADAGN